VEKKKFDQQLEYVVHVRMKLSY